MNIGSDHSAIFWANKASILAVESAVYKAKSEDISTRTSWNSGLPEDIVERWDLLIKEGEQIERVTKPANVDPIIFWLFSCLSAVECYPEAAAAFSILNENENLSLLTPSTFARLMLTTREADYESVIAQLFRPANKDYFEFVEPVGSNVPLTQRGVRLKPEYLGVVFDAQTGSRNNIEPPSDVIIFEQQAQTARSILESENIIMLSAHSRRMARQFALDIASLSQKSINYLKHKNETATIGAELTTGIIVHDLFDWKSIPYVISDSKVQQIIIINHETEAEDVNLIEVPNLSQDQAQLAWHDSRISKSAQSSLSRKFNITIPEVRSAIHAAHMARLMNADSKGGINRKFSELELTQAILKTGSRRMGNAVVHVTSDVDLDDLVVSDEIRAQLEDAVAWYQHGSVVWQEMGIRSDSADTKGLSLLFSGPPGGGKTFAARCLAKALGLNLYRIDLSQVVSKYIGDTEKALAKIFDEAEAGHGLLFFDEADSIFGRRSEVKDAHDRYANIEVGYLLQRMERFNGVMILATNLRSNMDPAFMRRLRFTVHFPMPSFEERHQLWLNNLPHDEWFVPELEIEFVAKQFHLSGGSIRNTAVAAAHLAAADARPIGNHHLAKAIFRELEKVGLSRSKADFGKFAKHLEMQK